MISVYARVNYLTLTYTLFVLAVRIERLQPRCSGERRRCFGELNSGLVRRQERLLVEWTRLQLPRGGKTMQTDAGSSPEDNTQPTPGSVTPGAQPTQNQRGVVGDAS